MYIKKESLNDEDVSVTLYIDNTLKSFPSDSNEIVLRKLIGKDLIIRYTVNEKKMNHEEFKSLLELGGISRMSSFSFLNTNQITKLANSTGEELYCVLKEMTGVKIYESKKDEIKDILNKTSKVIR